MKAGLLGRKLGHSLSPQIHRLFGDYDYRLYEREPEEVADFVRTCGLDFLNVTIPYKQTVFALCDELTPMAKRLGNVNFVRRTPEGRLLGDNTDAYGVERLLDSVHASVAGRRCAILGAGGAAMTVKAVLEQRGAAEAAFVRRGERPSPDAELIVNATPVGMYPDVDGVRIDISEYPSCRTVLDLVYNPSPTRLVREARQLGKTAADGLVMLIAQAYRAYEFSIRRIVESSNEVETIEQSNNREIEQFSHPLYLYGPPASGKSTLARQLALATGRTAVDLDDEIVKLAGRPIPEIFAAQGEAAFRALERTALERVSAEKGLIVALGGGALIDDACRRLAEAGGRVVVLDCDLATLQARLTGPDRPLSASAAKLEALMKTRAAHYASFARHVKMIQ